MPPRITQESYRPRVSERTMVGTEDHFCLPVSGAEWRRHARKMKFLGWQKQVGQVASPLRATSRVHGIKGLEKPSFAPHRGWMPRQKSCWPPVVGKLFLLTSPSREHPLSRQNAPTDRPQEPNRLRGPLSSPFDTASCGRRKVAILAWHEKANVEARDQELRSFATETLSVLFSDTPIARPAAGGIMQIRRRLRLLDVTR